MTAYSGGKKRSGHLFTAPPEPPTLMDLSRRSSIEQSPPKSAHVKPAKGSSFARRRKGPWSNVMAAELGPAGVEKLKALLNRMARLEREVVSARKELKRAKRAMKHDKSASAQDAWTDANQRYLVAVQTHGSVRKQVLRLVGPAAALQLTGVK